MILLYLQWEKKVEEGKKNFESTSKVLKKEVKKFEVRDGFLNHVIQDECLGM